MARSTVCLLFLYFLYFCKAPITSYIFAHFLYFPVFFVIDNVAAVSNTVNRKNAEEHINNGPDKSSTEHKHTTSSSKPKSTNSKSVTKEVTSKK